MEFRWSTIGHDAVKRYVESFIASGEFPAHAFVFCGAEHMGKTLLAREFVSMAMCVSEEVRPCGTCLHCTHLARQSHPDVYTIRPNGETASGKSRSSLSVEDVREVIEQLHTRSLFKHKKICFVEDAQLLTTGASNALLKTLEEPRGETLFVIVSHSEEALLPTIRSRCQLVRVYPLSTILVHDELMKRGFTPTDAWNLSRFSRGRLGTIWKFLEEPSAWVEARAMISRDIQTLFGPGAEKHRWYEDSDTIPFQEFVRYANDALLVALDCKEQTDCGFEEFAMLKRKNLVLFVKLLETCMSTLRWRSQNVNPKLLLDLIHTKVRSVI